MSYRWVLFHSGHHCLALYFISQKNTCQDTEGGEATLNSASFYTDWNCFQSASFLFSDLSRRLQGWFHYDIKNSLLLLVWGLTAHGMRSSVARQSISREASCYAQQRARWLSHVIFWELWARRVHLDRFEWLARLLTAYSTIVSKELSSLCKPTLLASLSQKIYINK